MWRNHLNFSIDNRKVHSIALRDIPAICSKSNRRHLWRMKWFVVFFHSLFSAMMIPRIEFIILSKSLSENVILAVTRSAKILHILMWRKKIVAKMVLFSLRFMKYTLLWWNYCSFYHRWKLGWIISFFFLQKSIRGNFQDDLNFESIANT